MERLNNIIGRTTPRRSSPEQRSYTGGALPNPRGQQASQPVSRRPLPEQTRRAGQQYPSGSQPAAAQPSQAGGQGRRLMRQNLGELREEPEYRPYNETHGQVVHESYARPQPSASRPGNYQRTEPTNMQPVQQAPEYTQRDAYQAQRTRPFQTRPESSYYHADDYMPAPHGDAIEDWNEEDEEGEAGMCYGDWERDGQEVLVYKRAQREIVPMPQLQPAKVVREPAPAYPDAAARVTRDLRDLHQVAPPSLPAPQPSNRAQEIQPQQRVTQPLRPRTLAGLERERQLPSPEGQRASRTNQARHEQVQQSRPVLQPTQIPPTPQRQVCPKCKGAGYLRANVPFGHPNFGKPIACECKEAERKEKRRQQLRSMSNLDAFRNHNFRTFNARVPGVQDAYDAAREFAASPEGWLLLVGPNGCGKTHLAAAIANQALDSGSVVLFEAVPDLLDHLRAAFAPTATEVYDQLFAKMREAEVLILDDLGAQQSSPWANEKLFQLLNYRYNMEMPTVITANQKGLQGIDERIRSRLHDHSLVVQIMMDRARDYRPNNIKR